MIATVWGQKGESKGERPEGRSWEDGRMGRMGEWGGAAPLDAFLKL